jgi:hypothetical protein
VSNFGTDLGFRVGHRENDRLIGHLHDILFLKRTCCRDSNETVSSIKCLFQCSVRSIICELFFPLVHSLSPTLVDDSLRVTNFNVFFFTPVVNHQLEASDSRSSGTVKYNFNFTHIFLGDVAGVDQTS